MRGCGACCRFCLCIRAASIDCCHPNAFDLCSTQSKQKQCHCSLMLPACALHKAHIPLTGGSPAGCSSSSGAGDLAYSRKPRNVEYQPYSQKEFEDRNYDVKKAAGYWQLGRLGPDLETQELQAKVSSIRQPGTTTCCMFVVT